MQNVKDILLDYLKNKPYLSLVSVYMQKIPTNTIVYAEYEKMFGDITDISLNKNIAPFSVRDEQVAIYGRQHHYNEIDHLKEWIIGPFTRTVIMQLPLKIHNKEGKYIDIDGRIWSRTMQNFINDDIVQNIRSAGSIDLLDIHFDFFLPSEITEFSEYQVGDEVFYKNIKEHVISYIKEHPIIEKAIVDNYCDAMAATFWYMKTKEQLLQQREKTTKDLFLSLGMPKWFTLKEHNKYTTDSLILSMHGWKWKEILSPKQVEIFTNLLTIGNEFWWFDTAYQTKGYIDWIRNNNKELQKIVVDLKNSKKTIDLDSKCFFLDNGDNLYDDVIEKSEYHKYYKEELDLIQKNQEKILPYLKKRYIGLWCGNGKKDYAMIAKRASTNTIESTLPHWEHIEKILLMDSSLKSLSKAEKAINKNIWWFNLGTTTVMFSQEWIDTLLDTGEIKTLTSVTNHPHESIMNIPDIREKSNMFTLFGWTLWNFWWYRKTFLEYMNRIMNVGDILCVSLFSLPKNEKEIRTIMSRYDTSENSTFIKNFFIKLGIPQDAIEVHVTYKDKSIHIDAKIDSKNGLPIKIHPTGEEVKIPNGTIFHCISSERMDEQGLQNEIDQSQGSLKIIDEITSPKSPFTLYMIAKQ